MQKIRLFPEALVVVFLFMIFAATVWFDGPVIDRGQPPCAAGILDALDENAGENMLADLLSDIRINGTVSDSLNSLYGRHSLEIGRLLQEDPTMLWEAVGIVTDALPSLRAAAGNGGRLVVEKQLYARASNLLEQYRALSSPELSRDLSKARSLVESRMREADAGHLQFDLR